MKPLLMKSPARRKGAPRRTTGSRILATSAIAMSVAAFAAAPTASATAKNASSVTTITWWASPISTSGPDLRKVLIADFEKAYPNIKVNLQTAPTDTDTNRPTS